MPEKHQQVCGFQNPAVDKVILFDGICNFCNGAVDFICKRDPKWHFRFAALQSEDGQAFIAAHWQCAHALTQDSLILIEGGRMYVRSDAALRIARGLRFPWSLCYGFMVIPRTIRDALYDFVARRRYRWFGRRDVCRRPTASELERFRVWRT